MLHFGKAGYCGEKRVPSNAGMAYNLMAVAWANAALPLRRRTSFGKHYNICKASAFNSMILSTLTSVRLKSGALEFLSPTSSILISDHMFGSSLSECKASITCQCSADSNCKASSIVLWAFPRQVTYLYPSHLQCLRGLVTYCLLPAILQPRHCSALLGSDCVVTCRGVRIDNRKPSA